MRILVTGQCTVHWGRLEHGNIGNYYIVEAAFKELRRVFPESDIVTTFQMTEDFCAREQVITLPMELYYGWREDDLKNALYELGVASLYQTTGKLAQSTPYIEEVKKSDLIIDFSGEMWGYHADLVGPNRFLVGLIKDRVAQLLGKPTAMLAGSQGGFPDPKIKEFAKLVFCSFDLVANREPETEKLLTTEGFDISRLKNYACPAFLFKEESHKRMEPILKNEKMATRDKPLVGFVLCGFNMTAPPYDKWPREESEYDVFAEAIEFIVDNLGARVVLMSHSNGFDLPPGFQLKHGRDYPIVKQLQQIVHKRSKVRAEDVCCIDNVYNPWQTKAIIGQFDMFVTGRLHASVAAISQNVPTVVMMHGHGQESHKTVGFFKIAELEEYVVRPDDLAIMLQTIASCWAERSAVRAHLQRRIPEIKHLARASFDALKELVAQ